MKEILVNKLNNNLQGGKFWGTETVFKNFEDFCYCKQTYDVFWVAIDTEAFVFFGNC